MRIVELRKELKSLISWKIINISVFDEILDEIQELSEKAWECKAIEKISNCIR